MYKKIISKINIPSHAYLIITNDDKFKDFTNEFVRKFNISKFDLINLNIEKSLKIGEIRKLQHNINLKSHSSSYKVAVIRNCDKMTPEASNALLKTLEEPPQKTIILLQTSDEKKILSTIVSRCAKIRINFSSKAIIKDEDRELFKELKNNNIKQGFDFASKLSKAEIADTIDKWLEILREDINKNNIKLIKIIYDYKKMLDYNVNERLLMENIILEMR